MTCEACRTESVCAYKFWYLIVALLMLAYGIGSMFIPMAFPWDGPADAVDTGAWLMPLLFSAGFVAANVIACWGVAKIFAGPIARREGDKAYYMEKIRNSMAASFGFVAAFRIIIYLMWMVHYS